MHFVEYFEKLKGRELVCLFDSPDVREAFLRSGFERLADWDNHDFAIQEPCFAVISRYESLKKMKTAWDTSRAYTSHIAAAKFDTSLEGLCYTLERLLAADARKAIEYRSQVYDEIANTDVLHFRKGGTDLRCEFEDELEIANCDVEMSPGWFYSIAEWFEASIVNIQGDRSSFTLSGSFEFDGLIHLANNPRLKADCAQDAQRLLELSACGDNLATFEDNRLVALRTGGTDQTATLQRMFANDDRRLGATEYALGCVKHDDMRWGINSLLNESTYGMHIGIGTGQEAPHIDFIARDLSLADNSSSR